MRLSFFSVAIVSGVVALAGCSGGSSAETTDGSGESDLSAGSFQAFNAIVDDCTQLAVGTAAVSAFASNNLQHLESLTVDGTPGVSSSTSTFKITTGNDEDGDTSRKIVINEDDNVTTGHATCTLKSMSPADKASHPSATDVKNAFSAVVDTCTKYAINTAAKKAFADNNLQHLHGFSLDGDPAVSGLIHYTVITGNDEDGDTTYKIDVTTGINEKTGKISCKAGKTTSSH